MSQQNSITSIVYNVQYAKQLGVPPHYYRYRSCNPNFPNRTQTSVGGFTPADQYQKLKIIQFHFLIINHYLITFYIHKYIKFKYMTN